MFEVKWTGVFPCLCHGEWLIKKNGINVSKAIPKTLKTSDMGTFKKYEAWSFSDGWEEVWTAYEDGFNCEDWIAANDWITAICDSHSECVELFNAINAEDWRHGSCGG